MQELHGYQVSSSLPGSILDNSETLLQDLNSGSKVAKWRLWLWLFAVGSWVCEQMVDAIKAAIEAILAAERPHTLNWYSSQSKKFQYGYGLSWVNNQWVYLVNDDNAKVVKYAAACEENGKVIMKVQNEVGGSMQKLTNDEKSAFDAFWAKNKDAGVKVESRSADADVLKVNITVIRDRMVLASDNSLLRDSTVFPIANAIAAFGDALEFNGIIYLDKLCDAIQNAEGVVSAKINSAQWKAAGGVFANVDMFVNSYSGYFVIDATSTWTFIDLVNVQIQS